MSPSLSERLRELETEVRDLRVRPAAEVRARGRRRGHRQRTAVAAGVVVVVATAGVAAGRSQPPPEAVPVGDGPAPACDLSRPAGPAEVRVRVLDGGAPAGVRTAVAADLRVRAFAVADGPGDAGPERTTGLRYGPAAVGDAALVGAYLPGGGALWFDPGRRDATVDLVLGPDFRRLASTTEVNRNLVAAGEPVAPPGC